MLLAATGTVIGFEDQVSRFLEKISPPRVSEKNQVTAAVKLDEAPRITPDEAVAIARVQLPGAIAYRVQMPRYGGLYVIALEYAQNRVTGKRNFISLDPENGKIVSAQMSSDFSFGARFLAANGAIHNGSIWGMPSRIVAALASIVLPIQVVSGLLIWLRRKGILHTR